MAPSLRSADGQLRPLFDGRCAMPRKWIETRGGPLVAMPQSLLREWEGGGRPNRGRIVAKARSRSGDASEPWTDYERACEVGDYLGFLSVGFGQALVLAEEPLRTCFIPRGEGGVFARWRYGESAEEVDSWLAVPPSLGFKPGRELFRVQGTPVLVFDSVFPGTGAPEYLELDLPPGRYRLATLEWKPDERTALLLHSIERTADASQEATSADGPPLKNKPLA